jgi:hypothetical protein
VKAVLDQRSAEQRGVEGWIAARPYGTRKRHQTIDIKKEPRGSTVHLTLTLLLLLIYLTRKNKKE